VAVWAKDDTEAAGSSSCAADQGNAGGQSNLGHSTHRAAAVCENDREAARLFKLAQTRRTPTRRPISNIPRPGPRRSGEDDREAPASSRLAAAQGNAGGSPISEYSTRRPWRSGEDEVRPHALKLAQPRKRRGQTNLGIFLRAGRVRSGERRPRGARLFKLAADQR